MTKITYRNWLIFLIVILVSTGATAAFLLWRSQTTSIAETADLNPDCDLQKSGCTVEFSSGGKLHLSIDPKPIKGQEPLNLRVRSTDIEARRVEVDFAGVGMNMGFNRPELVKDGEQEFSGTGMLSVCTLDQMYWDVRILAHTSDGILIAPFRFATKKAR